MKLQEDIMDISNNFSIQSLLRDNPSQDYHSNWKNQKLFYYNPQITFREVPDEVSLTIPTLCYNQCSQDCNSQFCWFNNWEGKKQELTFKHLLDLIRENEGITCLTIMTSLNFKFLQYLFSNVRLLYPNLKTALYVGADWEDLVKYKDFHCFNFQNLDYIKIGRFKKEFGPLDNPNTNQRFYKISHTRFEDIFEDITYKFIEKPL